LFHLSRYFDPIDVEDATNAPEVIKIVRELLAASYELRISKNSEVEKQYLTWLTINRYAALPGKAWIGILFASNHFCA
jgi:hypothetical protein